MQGVVYTSTRSGVHECKVWCTRGGSNIRAWRGVSKSMESSQQEYGEQTARVWGADSKSVGADSKSVGSNWRKHREQSA